MSFTCPRRTCGFWAADPAAMAAHRATHGPSQDVRALERGARLVGWAAAAMTVPVVLLVVGALVFIAITGTPID
jgi:hypothetical protein